MTIHSLREKIEEARGRREGVAGFSYDPDRPHNLNRKRGKVVGVGDIFTALKAADDAGTAASGEGEVGGASERLKMRRKGVQEALTELRKKIEWTND